VRLPSRAERKLQQLASGNVALVRASHASGLLRFAVRIAFVIVALSLTYVWLTFTLRRFPYTRPWGESLRAFLIERLTSMGLLIAGAIPNLFTVLLIFLLIRFAVKLAHAFFDSVLEGRLDLPYVHPETAQPTRRLVTVLFWLLGLVVAYPYLPGSGSDAFKGLSVFVGLVLSLGSSGVVNQLMSGLTLTYSRAMRAGDFVRIGDVEGTITQLGGLSTKVKTPRGEEVTIPNAVVMTQVTTNYSRFAATEGVYVPTSLTIGYDTPWRQVHALLLLAAERTPGIRATPAPAVRQTALQDFYVQYTLLVCLEQPQTRLPTLTALHANIQDAFNEYGVQIMSPNYEADPEGRKVVPPEQWYAAPAKPAISERVSRQEGTDLSRPGVVVADPNRGEVVADCGVGPLGEGHADRLPAPDRLRKRRADS
jgi:small-conductance mechanosensitive channel